MALPPTVLTIEKVYNNEFWVNVYYLSSELGSSASPANAIVAAERSVTCSAVVFTKYSLRTTVEDDYVYATIPLNLAGTRTSAVTPTAPLFNTVRVDFQAALGRPSRKYLRGCLMNTDLSGANIVAGVVTYFQTNYADVVSAVTTYVDVDGDDITAGAVSPLVGMRQLRRGSKKPVTP